MLGKATFKMIEINFVIKNNFCKLMLLFARKLITIYHQYKLIIY